MKVRIYYITLVTLIAACGTEKPQPENRTMDTTSVTVDTATTTANEDSAVEVRVELRGMKKIPFQQKCDSFITAYLPNYNQQEYDKRHMLMRFENAWMKQVALIKKFKVPYGENEVNPQAYIGFYEYADSSQRANAYSNWLACFGSDCNQIVPETEVQIKSTPGFYIINEKEIITLDYPLEHEKNNWIEMKKNLRVLFANPTSTIIEVAPHGRVRWLK